MRNTSRSHERPTIVAITSLKSRPLSRAPVWRLLSIAIALIATVLSFTHLSENALASAKQAQPELPLLELRVGGVPLTVEVASTNQQRYMGLSFRESLATDRGMLFAYPEERALTFTMRNTKIPLSIAFISKDLVVNEIHLMNVGPDQLFHSRSRAQYALEVNQGWFKQHGIKPGDTIKMP